MNADLFHCSGCGGIYDYSVYQNLDDEPPSWSASGGCSGSEGRVEIDGHGLPSPEFRAVIFAKEGVRELTIGPSADTISTLRHLQKTLALPASVAAPLGRKIPGVVLSGTPQEIQWLVSKLSAHEIPASSTMSSEPRSIDLADVVSTDWRQGRDWILSET